MKAIQIEQTLRQMGVENGMKKIVTDISERQNSIEKDQTELAAQMLEMATMLAKVVDGAGAMRDQLEQFQAKQDNRNDMDDLPSATG